LTPEEFRSSLNLAFAAIIILIAARSAFASACLAYYGFAKGTAPTPHSIPATGTKARIWAAFYSLYAVACLAPIPLFVLALQNTRGRFDPAALLVRGYSLEGGLMFTVVGGASFVFGLALAHLARARGTTTRRGEALNRVLVFTLTFPAFAFAGSLFLAVPIGVPWLVLLGIAVLSPVFKASYWIDLSSQRLIRAA
jgi:hypothetical protein